MSKGMPSMAALLGMIAVAGYQNRDKLIEMYNSATSGPEDDGPVAGNDPAAATTGVREIVDALRNAGQGSVADSWVSSGRNEPIEPSQLENAVGSATLDRLATETGLAKAEILKRLTADLPSAVDGLTPTGSV